MRLICLEDSLDRLLSQLALNSVDLILSDAPVTSTMKVRAFNHLLGESSVSILGTKELAKKYRRGFPGSLNGAPILLPTRLSSLRRELDRWLDASDLRPIIRAEFDDSALLKVFGQAGEGLFPVPTVIEAEVRQQYQVEVVGRIDSIREQFYAISGERKLKHPAVVAITEAARQKIFRQSVTT